MDWRQEFGGTLAFASASFVQVRNVVSHSQLVKTKGRDRESTPRDIWSVDSSFHRSPAIDSAKFG